MFLTSTNEADRQTWLRRVLASITNGSRLLDAGAGELRNRVHCGHLEYVSQDFGQYTGGDTSTGGLHSAWDAKRVDIVSDIANIPEPDASFDAVLCSEVLEHIPEPLKALDEFARLLKPNGVLILTAPFVSLVHMAPYHFCTGFSRYWYEHHLPRRGFQITELSPNGDWYSLCRQEVARLGSAVRRSGHWSWPAAYGLSLAAEAYFRLLRPKDTSDLACLGWHCVANKH